MRGLIFKFTLFITPLIISCNKAEKLFVNLPSSKTNITFQNDLTERKGLSILYYLYYYNGGGVATGDINNDGLPDVYFTANSKGNNKLYLNKGNFEFEDITAKAGVDGTSDWCTGVTMADINGDGFLDMYVCSVSNAHGLKGNNELYINNRNGTFTESAAKYGLNFSGFSTQAAFFDYDHDGDLDCYLLNQSQKPHANIVDTSNRRKFDPYAGDRFYRNDMNTAAKKFTDISATAGIYQSSLGYGLGIAVADFNNDGWEDVYIGNDFHENDYYYLNNGNGTFSESGAEHFNHYSRFTMGNDAADFNNDGNIDIITADMLPNDEKILKTYGSDENPDTYKFKLQLNGYQDQYSKNCLQRNNGNGTSFSEIGLLSGVSATDWSWSPLFADFDNDGNKDLFISSGIVKRPVDLDYIRFVSDLQMKKGMDYTDKYDAAALEKMPDGSSHPYLFKSDGKLSYSDVSSEWGSGDLKGYFNGAAYADLDNDGNLDLVVNCINAPAVVLKNNAPKKHFLSIAFKGDSLNTSGIGCKAYLFQKNKIQYQQLMLTRGFQSSSDSRLHFGLDSTSVVDSMLVVWPGNNFQVIKNVAADQQLVIQQKNAVPGFTFEKYFPQSTPALQDISGEIKCNWKHKENDFVDFNIQYLIPHKESTRGPKLAVGDINNDGLDDLYACGARGQAGALLEQQPNGTFAITDSSVFSADAGCEDVDAVFFDANGDGFKDLYVVSGGNELTGADSSLPDRLYMNDGKGHFTRTKNALPPVFENKSCISVADIDRDGDADVFVGTLANARAFGIPQTSYLFINEGKGHFTVADQNIISISNIGVVTAAQFSDVNMDGWSDLVVGGEWMPVIVFINNKGTFRRSEIINSSGMWQSIFINDINRDGHPDILAGNWGWNNKFHSGKNGPVKLYVSDFDKNGQTEQLLSYTLNGEEFPFLAKDEVERPLPLLKKHYLSYTEYAGVPMKDVFYGWVDTVKPYVCETLGSAIFYGDGAGNFKISNLPAELQLAPLFAFQMVANSNSFIAGGNFFGTIPYEGRYDASSLLYFNVANNGQVTNPQILDTKGEVRDLKWIRTAKYGSVLVVARNNEALSFYTPRSGTNVAYRK